MNTSAPMIPFLRSVANEIVSMYGSDLHDMCMVLPGRRASLFMSQYISDVVETQYGHLTRPGEMPRVMTFAELAEKLSGLRAGTRLELIFTLFGSWKKVNGGEGDFDRFRTWAETVLRDFDEIDSYDVDAGALFHNVSSHNEISTDYLTEDQREVVREYFGAKRPAEAESFWRHFNGKSKLQRSFMELWQMLDPLYKQFNADLLRAGFAYPGALLHHSCESVRLRGKDALPGQTLVFVGLDSLTPAQVKLLRMLRDFRDDDGRPVADFFWDMPGVPLAKDSPVDAGRSQWEVIDEFPCSVKGMDNYTSNLTFPPVLDVISCPGNSAQTKVAGMLLSDIVAGRGAPFTDPARVAVVLPDESLLFPMYYAVPAQISADVNLTMGYPMHMTSAAAFVALLRKMQRTGRVTGNNTLFHYKEVRALLAHPYMRSLLSAETVELMQGEILSRHLFYVSVAQLLECVEDTCKAHVGGLLDIFFRPMRKDSVATDACVWLRDCLVAVFGSIACRGEKRKADLEIDHLRIYIDAITEFETLAAKHGICDIDWRTALVLIDRMLQNHTVHLQGRPMTGVQIMGMLETRALDFDYLIIPSMNERIFPARMRVHTFIPESLRRGWGLPTVSHKEQAYAYHFYRLLARAREVHMLYDASQSGRKSGDPSRYLLQLRYLFGKACNLRWRSARFHISTPVLPSMQVRKDENDLAGFLTAGSGVNLSASALKDYLACPMRFYIAHVLKKKLQKEPEEFMDAATQGTILHDSMQEIYNSLLTVEQLQDGKPVRRHVTREIIQGWLDGDTLSIDAIVEGHVRRQYAAAGDMQSLRGDVRIMAEVIALFVRACLKADLELAPFDYLDNEHKLTVEYEMSGGRKVNMTFIIDRLDMLWLPGGESRLRIVDYKTGSDTLSFKKIGDLFHPSVSAGNTKGVFQLMLYALLYPVAYPDFGVDKPIALSLYCTRELEARGLRTMVEYDGIPVYSHLPLLDEYRQMLNDELEELFDPQRPFVQTSDTTKCTFCDFRQLCGR